MIGVPPFRPRQQTSGNPLDPFSNTIRGGDWFTTPLHTTLGFDTNASGMPIIDLSPQINQITDAINAFFHQHIIDIVGLLIGIALVFIAVNGLVGL